MSASYWAIMGVSLLLLGGCREPAPPAPPKPSPGTAAQPLLSVEGTTLHYNGQLLPWDAPIERWRLVLGPPSREVMGILVWDELGLFVYDQNAQVPGPESFEVLFGRAMHSKHTQGEPEHWPRKTFPGRLIVDGAPISHGSTLEEINRDKKGTVFGRSATSGVYKYSVEDFSVWLDYGHDRTLTAFSVTKHLPESQ